MEYEAKVFGADAAGLAKWHWSIHGENNNPYPKMSEAWKVYEQTYDRLDMELDQINGNGGSYEMP